MKRKVTITIEVYTEDYSDVKTDQDIQNLVKDMIEAGADWPEQYQIKVEPA